MLLPNDCLHQGINLGNCLALASCLGHPSFLNDFNGWCYTQYYYKREFAAEPDNERCRCPDGDDYQMDQREMGICKNAALDHQRATNSRKWLQQNAERKREYWKNYFQRIKNDEAYKIKKRNAQRARRQKGKIIKNDPHEIHFSIDDL